MNDFWSPIVTAVVSGIATAVVWAILLGFWWWTRNRVLEKEIRASLSKVGLATWATQPSLAQPATTYTGFLLHNETHVAVTIREVSFLLNGPQVCRFTLLPYGPGQTLSEQLAEADRRGFVELRPWTEGRWGCSAEHGDYATQLVQGKEASACRIEAHYLTLFGKPRRITVDITPTENPVVGHLWSSIAKQGLRMTAVSAS